MTTIIATFFIALVISLVATPLAKLLGNAVGAVDRPNERKMHHTSMPRSGGMAIFGAFLLTILLTVFLDTPVSRSLVWNTKMIGFMVGAVLVFAIGFLDDIYRLSAKVKLLFQVLAVSVAFASGLQIHVFFFTKIAIHSVIISYCLTVFWFVLLINAINLSD